jgi:hypothetical protein
MSGEAIVVYGAKKVLKSAGALLANNALLQADDATYDVTVDGVGYPDAIFTLSGQFATAPTEGTVISVFARPLAIDGTNDSEIPEAARPTRFIGAFVVNNVTTLQAMELLAVDLPRKASYYLMNSGTGQSLSAGWQLSVYPRTYKMAP